MRLLSLDDQGVFVLTQYETSPPAYGILSHRWGQPGDEVSFRDVQSWTASAKDGFKKLTFCMDQARLDGLQHIWIDTCCIDKSNDAELNSSIRSMFSYYANAQHCYAYLTDIDYGFAPDTDDSLGQYVAGSLWFTRGWTLQELLAPKSVKFFDHKSQLLGTKHDFAGAISAVTGINVRFIVGEPISHSTIKERFTWAERRQTTEPEDVAYCLIGLLDLPMNIQYGEGQSRAFERLQMCILREDERSRFDAYAAKIIDYHSRGALTTFSRIKEVDDGEAFTIAQVTQELRTAPKRRRAAIIRYLKFDAMEVRRAIINEPLMGTCGWILSDDAFLAWKRHEETFLWVKGHPGAGKSTLMKSVEYALSAEANSVLISFYFSARGTLLERSVSGMYRSLIVQLLNIGDVSHVLDRFTFRRQAPPNSEFFRDAPLAVLRELLAACIARLKVQVWCIIDALDETSDEDVVEMVDFLAHLDQGRLSICLASRHYPALDLPIRLQIILDHGSGHHQDVESYVEAKLNVRADPRIRAEITEKANGIFMWVVLVIGILNKEYRSGSILKVRKKLRELPPGLIDLLGVMARQTDVPDDDFILCLQWILYARRPLTLNELYHAVHLGLGEGNDVDDVEELMEQERSVGFDDMERFLVTYSKGMAEVSQGQVRRVQFIHESIREWLLGKKGMQHLCGDHLDTTEASAHRRLSFCCLRSYQARIKLRGLPPRREDAFLSQFEMARLPLFEYTLSHARSHVKWLSSDNPTRKDFQRSFNSDAWIAWVLYAGLIPAELEATAQVKQLQRMIPALEIGARQHLE